ncbi:CHAD domain-containing protein [Pimelobacter simplex]|uniref:CHAD domain-containing protein n=1 Tax=Nocardioides simplex TaxID=2045 RepID=UPI002150676A|nr:CHAD domain-containing protein [Pimelobacter simplex]UUW89437.1 CHAD domain-containing protein [Pimelobacter simplex]UUW93266.1 CHAD domain-containing protein [Pimelobacter simplex]
MGGVTDASAAELLAEAVGDLVADLRRLRAPALADEPDAVHQLRTTVRRLRNLLAGFRRCFRRGPADELRTRLAAYGALLGEGRDLEVRADDCRRVLAELGRDDLVDTLVAPLLAGHTTEHARLVAWHDSDEAAALDALLDRWATRPPLHRERAARPARSTARRAVRREVGRVLDRAEAAGETSHEVRKAARRLRHVAEVAGDDRAALLGKEIQGRLGDHRDAVLLAAYLWSAGAPALVVAHVEAQASRALEDLPDALRRLRAAPGRTGVRH